ncbi:MAG: Crp/Fnr family transcriptional regulator [Candidatus Pseudobacter hemicellulosilyticus]|uniref:Crp/Fnr family transcriptional regulator n=1 Tax=Candidatus Pseudobacter hemicellulosilyticus TaxID=3121375 RepID=A0AAJ5WN23_9BACT|nr:MAG: Crp/Fnr family transcriptional regulator [Pseudobacter sp.]
MTAAFENYLRTQTALNEADIAAVCSLAIPRKLRRNESLLKAGEVCRHKTFILQGLLRTYSAADDGSEPILQFSPELHWTLDAESYNQQLPSRYHIAAVESSELLCWQKSDFEQLLATIPGMKKHAEDIISQNIYLGRQRLLAALSASPEEKYKDFGRTYPDLLSRLPLRMIAAYLGISLKTLTRIRHAQWAR